ncbi:hypothetical protein CRUP_026253 [Coryphaenoides rupestris]|nr:hypothetical protein CRUP_026253 [Coryphaenoides rupestris]
MDANLLQGGTCSLVGLVWRWRTGECTVLRGHKEQLWKVEGGAQLQDVEAHQAAILSCHVSPDGRLAATTSADRTAKSTSSHV